MIISAHSLAFASFAALILGLTGTALLAYALDQFVDTTIFAVDALATSVESIATPGDRYIFGGLEVHLKQAKRRASAMTRIGLLVIVVSLAMQGFVLWAQSRVT